MRALVIGGARSGKSHFAEQLAQHTANTERLPLIYVATAQALDEEMEERIAQHRQNRLVGFATVEEPLEVASWLMSQDHPQMVLIDCLSLLLSNWIMQGMDLEAKGRELQQALQATSQSWIVVSNEVGMGIVPADALSRNYRDALGRLHQSIAQLADQVYLTIAGIPLDVKAWQAHPFT